MEEINLSDYILMLKQRRKTIFATTALTLLIVGVILAFAPKTYMGEVTLIFPSQQNNGLASQLLQMGSLPMLSAGAGDSGRDLYSVVLKSRRISDGVMDDLRLCTRCNIKRKEMMQALNVSNSKGIGSLSISFGVPTSWLKGKVQGEDLDSATAQLAADIANAYARRLKAYYRSNSFSTGRKNCAFIEGQIVLTKAELTSAENRLEKFQKAHPTLVPPDKSATYADQALSLSSKQIENDIALEDMKSQVDQARRTWKAKAPAGVSPASLVDNPVVLELQQELSKLEVKRATLLEDFTESHPSVVEVTQEIAKTKSKLNSEVSRVISGKNTNLHPAQQELLKELVQLEIGLKGTQAKRSALSHAMADCEKLSSSLPEKEMQYVRLLRAQKAAETVYTTLLAEQAKARISKDQDPSNFVVLDDAEAAEHPDKPKKKLVLGSALIAGLMLGMLIASAQGPTWRKK